MVKVPWCEGKSAAGSCPSSARSEEEPPIRVISSSQRKKRTTKPATLGGRLLRGHTSQQARNRRRNKKCPSPRGLRATSAWLREERDAAFLEAASLHFSPRGEAKCVRGPSGRASRRKPAQVPRFSRNTRSRDTNHGLYHGLFKAVTGPLEEPAAPSRRSRTGDFLESHQDNTKQTQ